MPTKPWGQHLIINGRGDKDSLPFVNDGDNLIAYAKELIPAIDMIAYGEPQIEYFAEGTASEGYTLIQLIETSNIAGHFNSTGEEAGDFYMDIFSCKTFDVDTALDVTQKYFNPVSIDYYNLLRSARMTCRGPVPQTRSCR